MEIGDTIDVYYSEDGIDWTYEVMSTVQDLAGEPYVVFTANHFTQFYLGEEIANFVINNDATNTTGLNVTLNSSVSGATDMRF
ncbi:hypothetical protein KKH82_03635 [Patescibacteria group bacterium]|nr:hypothetical protein [Patescibacteria group bacterium]